MTPASPLQQLIMMAIETLSAPRSLTVATDDAITELINRARPTDARFTKLQIQRSMAGLGAYQGRYWVKMASDGDCWVLTKRGEEELARLRGQPAPPRNAPPLAEPGRDPLAVRASWRTLLVLVIGSLLIGIGGAGALVMRGAIDDDFLWKWAWLGIWVISGSWLVWKAMIGVQLEGIYRKGRTAK